MRLAFAVLTGVTSKFITELPLSDEACKNIALLDMNNDAFDRYKSSFVSQDLYLKTTSISRRKIGRSPRTGWSRSVTNN